MVYATFTWNNGGDNKKIGPVLDKFQAYYQPLKNVLFERYIFNKHIQENDKSYDHYHTSLQRLADTCSFDTIVPDEILRDHLVFGIQDTKVREQLLREPVLTLQKTNEICHAAESTLLHIKAVGEGDSIGVSAVSTTADKFKERESLGIAGNIMCSRKRLVRHMENVAVNVIN